jgi:serine/threonine protein kinase
VNPDEEDPRLIEVAEAISDGVVLDWSDARAAFEDDALVDQLQSLETLASACRTQAEDGSLSPNATRPEPSRESHPPREFERWGSLRIIEPIGRGGFADVFRAYDPTLEREVALKLVRSGGIGAGAARGYLGEARRLASVRHPHVLLVHGADEHDGRVGIWTELLRGQTLEQILLERGVFGAPEAALIGMELCRALAAIHAAGLVHRDIKTSNVMREEGGRIVLLDFGATDEPSPEPAGRLEIGTPITMAPEQLRGGPVDRTADVYGLGVLLYRLVSGHFPIEADALADLRLPRAESDFVPLRDRRPDLPGEFLRVVERAMDPTPERRFASAGQMERALAAAAHLSLPPDDEPDRGATRAPKVIVVVAIAIAVAALGWILWRGPLRSHLHVDRDAPSSSAGANLATVRAKSSSESGGTIPPSAAPLTATASVFLDRQGAAVRLDPDDRVAPGDPLFLEFRAGEPSHVYVLDQDESGAMYVLYPVAGAEPSNPLSAGGSHRLPGSIAGRSFDWQVTSAGGREEIVVIAARRPIASLEEEIARIPHARAGAPIQYGVVTPHALATLRGIEGVTPAPRESAPPKGRLADLLRNLEGGRRTAEDPWVWQIALENSGAH